MLFNENKCKFLQIGRSNGKSDYKIQNDVLNTTAEEDIGVTIQTHLIVSEQCGIAARKGNRLLGMIRRNITYREKKLMVPLHKVIIRPHFEYCMQAWGPHLIKYIDKLERVQRRATQIISEMQTRCYKDRLKLCNLITLETIRIRGDQIEVFNIMHG